MDPFSPAVHLVHAEHVAGAVVEDFVQIFSFKTAAATFVPSDDEVIAFHFFVSPIDVSSLQFTPESIDFQMFPSSTTATNFVPSDDEVMSIHFLVAPTEESSIQVTPESVDVQMF